MKMIWPQIWLCFERPWPPLFSRFHINCQLRNFSNKPDKFFITTPIFYVNAAPHIGHLYSALIADTLHRWHRLIGVKTTIFSTGTDEHGIKIQQAAEDHGKKPEEFTEDVSLKFKKLFKEARVDYTDFVRTTDAKHIQAAEHFWQHLVSRDCIYEGSYSGWYCSVEEVFLGEDQLTDVKDDNGNIQKVSLTSGQPVVWTEEKNYIFRLSSFRKDLIKWLDSRDDIIRPNIYIPNVRAWLEQEIPDLSVSRERSRLYWGIPVPGDESQTMYVWLDALINYLTVCGYPNTTKAWPPSLQVIGKDILKFHAIYWPAFLMAAGLEPPQSILCHAHWLVDHQKMSKSRGNVVDPFDRMSKFSSDGLRYFLLREGVPQNDGNYSDKKAINIMNAELADTLGNLLSRCTSSSVNPQQIFPFFYPKIFDQYCNPEGSTLQEALHKLPDVVSIHYNDGNIYKALEYMMFVLRQTNVFLENQKPWELRKDPDKKQLLESVLYVAMESLRMCGILLQPVVPKTSDHLLTRLGIDKKDRFFKDLNEKDHVGKNLGPKTDVLFQKVEKID